MAARIPHLLCFCLLFGLLITQTAHASHLRAGEITVERISCTSLTFRITVTIYVDTESGVEVGGPDDVLDFGDNTSMLIPTQTTHLRPDLGKNMGIVVYTMEHTYSAVRARYTISYTELYRNAGIVNMDQSDITLFYLETTVYLDPFIACNPHLPQLGYPPIDRACTGVTFTHDPGATDLDGDSLSFELNVPKRAFNTAVFNYKDPSDRKFYLNFEAGNEQKNGIPSLSIDPVTGILTWDAPGKAGEYNVAFHIIEWRRDQGGTWRKISYVTRDMQIIVDDCDNNRPDLILPSDTCVVAGTILNKTIFGIDPDNDPVKIEVFSDVLYADVSPATYSPSPAVYQSSNPPARMEFGWKTSCEHVREQYYIVHFKISDNPGNDTKLATFKTWRIKVVAPPPQWKDTSVDLIKRSATVTWDSYTCSKATKMQVWRKIDGEPFIPDNCETGMPSYLGYTLLSTVPINGSSSQFQDTNGGAGLAPGARYCYRLVAVFPSPQGGESYVSRDTCLAPIQADAPVITHVTVQKTHREEGAIRISWYRPFEINQSQFPGPYTYEVYRGDGFTGEPSVRVTPVNRISDTTFVDALIDTHNEVYNYTIVLYSNTSTDLSRWVPVDTSAVASSVQLKASGNDDRIALSWKADVPWLNTSARYPYHLIYRGNEGDAPEKFTLIDSSSVITNGFTYTDTGTFNNTPLDKDKTYCYRIVTRGVYGNPKMNEPFENYSQTTCITPIDNEGPCTPSLSLAAVDCDAFFAASQCQVKEFTNKIHWRSDCGGDVRSYRIYAANGPDSEFLLVADNVRDTFHIDRNLSSFARCYKISAVDSHGNESGLSESVCNDNCPYFGLPNIFTPNGDECNEYFSAYGPFNPLNQNAPESCPLSNENISQCLRFVERVTFRVYNRWGKEVYSYNSGGGESSEYINWDGRDTHGQTLASGIYYYQAEVAFNTIVPAKKQQILKGWVHLAR
jgi:hypothetical protein